MQNFSQFIREDARESNAKVHDDAAAAHDRAAKSGATFRDHEDAWERSSKTGLLYTKSNSPAAHREQAENHRYVATKIRSGEIPSR